MMRVMRVFCWGPVEALMKMYLKGDVIVYAETKEVAIGLAVGLFMGLIQAATQLSEPAIGFVPRSATSGPIRRSA